MNRRSRQFIMESLLAAVISLLFLVLSSKFAALELLLHPLGLLPLVWLAFRYGSNSAVIFSVVVSLLLYFIVKDGPFSIQQWVTQYMIPLAAVGFAGLFAKNAHRTLNNRNYFSANLNLVTGSTIVALINTLLKDYLMPKLADSQTLFAWKTWGIDFLAHSVILSLLFVLSVRFTIRTILPPRSPYLSRKETSSLLND